MELPNKQEYLYTVEEYLEVDRATDERYEYIDGNIYQMAGESGAHADICSNFVGEIRAKLKGKNCRVRSKDTKVQSGALLNKLNQVGKGIFSYPDVVVICGAPEYHDKHKDIVLNSKIIIEVLSDSTENFDRVDKFVRYRMFNLTLTDYILVSQKEPVLEHFVRQPNNTWTLNKYFGLDKIIPIESVGISLEMTEIYELVEFSNEIV